MPVPQAKPLGVLASSARPEHISMPGATTSGLILPSIVGPSLEIVSTEPCGVVPPLPVVLAPTESTFFAVAGVVTVDVPVPSHSPTEKIGKRLRSSLTNWSTDLESAVYCPSLPDNPHALIAIRAVFCFASANKS